MHWKLVRCLTHSAKSIYIFIGIILPPFVDDLFCKAQSSVYLFRTVASPKLIYEDSLQVHPHFVRHNSSVHCFITFLSHIMVMLASVSN
jgi:hypothetical protein